MDDQLSRPGTDRRAKGAAALSEGGTPLPASSVVYLAQVRGTTSSLWTEVTTQENLAAVQANNEQFELRTLFKVPVDDVSRAPIGVVHAAVMALDQVERRRAKAERRASDRHPTEELEWEGELGLLAMKAAANELQATVELAQKSSQKFTSVRTKDAAQAICYIKYLTELAGKVQAGRCRAQGGNTSEESAASGSAAPQAVAGKVEVPEGWKLVPSKITEEMHVAAVRAICRATGNDDCPPSVWAAMLAASPVAPVAEKEQHDFRAVLTNVRDALQGLNDRPGGGISDTLWMPGRPETLFDYIDAALASPSTGEGRQQDERAAFETWARTACNMPADVKVNWDALWTKQAWEAWQARASLSSPAERQEAEACKPTDISQRLREYAGNPGYNHNDYADTMRQAAEEIERYYGGMLAWKQTAEKKDRDWNAERMARVNERCAARVAAPSSPSVESGTVDTPYGSTDFGWTFAGIDLSEGDKRLMAMLVHSLGSDHPAIDDMASLLFRACAAMKFDAATIDSARFRELVQRVIKSFDGINGHWGKLLITHIDQHTAAVAKRRMDAFTKDHEAATDYLRTELEKARAALKDCDQHTAQAVKAAREEAAKLAIKFTAVPRDCLGPATANMKTLAAAGEKIAAAIRALRTPQPSVDSKEGAK